MTEAQAKKIGFKFSKTFTHDEWHTARYKKGLIELEFTYLTETNKLDGIDITIDEVVNKTVTLDQLQQLDFILNN